MGYWSDRSIDGEDNWEERRKWAKENDAHCGRCYSPIPFDEKEFYEKNGICCCCAQMMRHDD
jgi:hypothetical protein